MSTIQTLDHRFTESTAIARTQSSSSWNYLWSRLRRLRGTDCEPEHVEKIYYPNYVAYSTVTIPRRFTAERVEKLLAGIDGLTSRVGAIDVDLPREETRSEDSEHVIKPTVTRKVAREEWREWIFEYASRKFRPIKRPNFELDSLELMFVPYWIVEFAETTYAVSDLTRSTDKLSTRPRIEKCYQKLKP